MPIVRLNDWGETLSKGHMNNILFLEKRCFYRWHYPVNDLNTVWWIASNGIELMGYAGLQMQQNRIYFCSVGVLPDYRGQGLAKQLTTARLDYCKDVNRKWLVADCHKDNVPSLNNLINFGFRFYSPKKRWGLKNSLYLKKQNV